MATANPIVIHGIDHVVLRVRDVGRMQRFYCDVLGCTVEKIQAEIGLTQLRAGRSLIDLVDVTGKLGQMGGAAPGEEGRNMDHLCLRVERLDGSTLQAYLQSKAVAAGEIVEPLRRRRAGALDVSQRSRGQYGRAQGAAVGPSLGVRPPLLEPGGGCRARGR